MKVRIIKTSIIYELPESYAMRLIEQRMAEFVSGDIPVTPEPEPEDIDQQQYEIGPDKELNNFSKLLRALKDDARSKRIDLYEGTYDILEEMGGQEFLDSLTGKEKWYEIFPVVPPNTEIVGHGRVEITMKLPETASESALNWLSPVTLMGSAKLKNLTIRCDTGYACVRAQVAGIADFSGAVWEIENCTLEYSKDMLVLGGGGTCCIDVELRSGVELHMRNCVCKSRAFEHPGNSIKITNQAIASALSPRVCIEDCAIDGDINMSSYTPPGTNPFTVVDVKIENSNLAKVVHKEALEETEAGNMVDCYRVTYINTPHTSSSYNIANLIPDVVYDNLDKKKSVLYTAQELTDAQKAQARTNIGALDLDALQIGGRNLLLQSATKHINTYAGSTLAFKDGVSVAEWGATDAIRCTGTAGTSSAGFGVLGGVSVDVTSVTDQDYVHSIYIRNDGANTIKITNNNMGGEEYVQSGESRRVVLKNKGNGAHIQFNFRSATAGDAIDITYWHPKIELGNVATDWTPAPEDAILSIPQKLTNNEQTIARTNIAAAASGHTHALTDKAITGILPASKGGMPAVTAADNGKFLRVVDGAWAAVTVPDAAEVKF